MDDNDHRVLGQSLDLYHIQDNAAGMVFWHPRGYAVYRILEDYIRGHMKKYGFKEIRTPQVMPRELWEKSGHWDKFAENMFTLKDSDNRDFALKPMSCPCHLQVYNDRRRSFRELPVRYSEFGACHRNESSGSMHGLMRTRAFEQDDAHVICRESQVQHEVARFITLLDTVYKELGFVDYKVALSTRPEVRAGNDELWDWAEAQLAEAARQNDISPIIQSGEGAFYGPKLEFVLTDKQGRDWQCGTVQLDTVLPARLDAAYYDETDSKSTPVMIHHAVFGSMGRFIAMLLEHYEGNLPFWLSPDQVAVLPISMDQAEYASRITELLSQSDIRTVLYDQNETLSRRLVDVHSMKIPLSIIVGKTEVANTTVTVREPNGKQHTILIDELVDFMNVKNTR